MVEGKLIKNIEKSLLVLQGTVEDVYIPYHRIIRIEFENEVIFYRPEREPARKKGLN